jgi:hypothetical protein
MRIASFDIGKKNFAFCVEECDENVLKQLHAEYKSLPKSKQRRIKGYMNEEVKNILDRVYKTSKIVEKGYGVFDIRNNKDSNDLDVQTRINMHNLLTEYEWLWDTCHVIVIEQQYFNISNGKRFGGAAAAKAGGANVDAIKLGECCLSWFLMKYNVFKEIIVFGSMYKTQSLGAPDGLTKPQRKKWSIEKGREILSLRNDKITLDSIENFKTAKGKKQKQDDIYDCIIMTQAYKYKTFIIEHLE